MWILYAFSLIRALAAHLRCEQYQASLPQTKGSRAATRPPQRCCSCQPPRRGCSGCKACEARDYCRLRGESGSRLAPPLRRTVATREPDSRPQQPWVPWCLKLHRHLCAPVGSFWAQMQGVLDYLSLASDASGTLCQDLSNSPTIFKSARRILNMMTASCRSTPSFTLLLDTCWRAPLAVTSRWASRMRSPALLVAQGSHGHHIFSELLTWCLNYRNKTHAK